MTQLNEGHVLALAGHGTDEHGPYLLLSDITAACQLRYHVFGRTFTLRRLPRRWCTGRYNLVAGASEACPLSAELVDGSKDTVCPACQKATGFNPSFYYAASLSPQQRAYNAMPHFVYLAYFAPGFVKAGISAEVRGMRRLLDQGARVARVVGRFSAAEDARELEASLCAQEGIFETMRATKKAELLANVRFDAQQAAFELEAVAQRAGLACAGGSAAVGRLALAEAADARGIERAQESYLDLSPCYAAGGLLPGCDELVLADASDEACAGVCRGMVGAALVLGQGAASYVVSLKSWIAHEVELFEDEVLHEYVSEPVQTSLF